MQHTHTITHIEIPAPRFTEAIEFYSAVFGWEIELVTVDHYAYFRIGNSGSGGAIDSSLLPAAYKTGAQLTIDTDNIGNTLSLIKKHGGEVIEKRTEIPGGHGFYAIFTDPNGNYLQLYSRE